MQTISKYGCRWDANLTDLEIEMNCIRQGGAWKDPKGKPCGMGDIHHYEQVRKILWPELDDHRWHRLCRDTILTSKVTVLLGCASSGKSHTPSWLFLIEYFCFPEDTCVLISSTHIEGLRLRIWAEITMLWQKAVSKFHFLPGHLLDSKLLISTDDINEDGDDDSRVIRDWRKGIKGIPCIQGGKFVGLGRYVGIKQKRMRLIADELQFMGPSFLASFANLSNNVSFKAVGLGNPKDPSDQLGRAAEPKDGWTNHMEPTKTEVWETKFMNGRCVNLVGTDSPNYDFPQDQPARYPYLISKEKIDNTLSFFPKDSEEYYSNCVGVMKVGVLSRRIITADMCRQYDAQKDVVWQGTPRIRIAALDAAYGGDRCVLGHIDFGKNTAGDEVIKCYPPVIVPVTVRQDMTPEDQIAVYVKAYCIEHGIEPDNFYHDSTGRGVLGTSLARIWSSQCNPVEFGGNPTERPVSLDLMISDPITGQRRHKRCDEHYFNFVSEMAYSVRYVIEGGQLRNLTTEVMDELCLRKWDKVRGDKIQVEPKTGTLTKPGMKQRVGFSPDLADWFGLAVEGARRRGFQIKKMGSITETKADQDYFETESREYQQAIKSALLKH